MKESKQKESANLLKIAQLHLEAGRINEYRATLVRVVFLLTGTYTSIDEFHSELVKYYQDIDVPESAQSEVTYTCFLNMLIREGE